MNHATSVCLLALILLVRFPLSALAEHESLDQLKQRAAAAQGGNQAKLCVKVAQLELQQADAAYKAGEAEQGRAAVSAIVRYAGQATQAASSSHKDLKRTETALRKISHKLSDLARDVSFEERTPIKEAIDNIESLRSQLLAAMFKP